MALETVHEDLEQEGLPVITCFSIDAYKCPLLVQLRLIFVKSVENENSSRKSDDLRLDLHKECGE